MAHSHSPSLTAAGKRPRFDVGEIVREHGAAYRANHVLGPQQLRALEAIERCRTERLGGHLDVCAACGDARPSYNSCRNRHCPKCQSLAQAEWLEKRKERILPTHYFHVVFTLPSELRPLCRRNARPLYDLLFASACQTLLDFGHEELGAQLGITAVLHTWTRDLKLHPHVHCVVTGGGLATAEERWIPTSARYLFPVKALATRFRGKVLAALRALHDDGALDLRGACAPLAEPRAFRRLLDSLYRTNWVVYAKRPFGGPEQVFEYLGRYTHRVAISNARLVDVTADEVRFRTRDGKHAALRPDLFLGRFLLHVLPRGFVKIRHFGLMASGNATTKLNRARALLSPPSSDTPASTAIAAVTATDGTPLAPTTSSHIDWRDRLIRLTGIDPFRCDRCGGVRVRRPLKGSAASNPAAPDTS